MKCRCSDSCNNWHLIYLQVLSLCHSFGFAYFCGFYLHNSCFINDSCAHTRFHFKVNTRMQSISIISAENEAMFFNWGIYADSFGSNSDMIAMALLASHCTLHCFSFFFYIFIVGIFDLFFSFAWRLYSQTLFMMQWKQMWQMKLIK